MTVRSRSEDLLADPDIAKAMAEGCSLKDVENGRRWYRRHGSRISMLQFRYGPKATEVQAAIDEGNQNCGNHDDRSGRFQSHHGGRRLASSSTGGPRRAASLAVADDQLVEDDTAIGDAMLSYSGPRTKRQGWPYLRNLRRHADMKISAADRARVWRVLRSAIPKVN